MTTEVLTVTTSADAVGNESEINGSLTVPVGVEQLFHKGLGYTLTTAIILTLIILTTIVGNVFVIAAIVLERNLQHVANYLVASLAVADLMVAALVMPLAAVAEVTAWWFLGRVVCDMWTSIDVLCCTSSILHLVAISIDRYWAVTRVDYIRNRSSRSIVVMIALSWVISTIISVPQLFGFRDSEAGEDGEGGDNQSGRCIISQDWGYTVFSTMGAFYIPLLFMIVIYLNVYRAARSRIRKKHFRMPVSSSSTSSLRAAAANRKRHRRLSAETTMSMQAVETPTTPVTPSSLQLASDSPGRGEAPPFPYLTSNSLVTSPTCLTVSTSVTSSMIPGSPSTPPLSPTVTTTPFLLGADKASSTSGWVASPPLSPNPSVNGTNGKADGLMLDVSTPQVSSVRSTERRIREKREQVRERKAARTLAIITGTFVICWLPFFIIALVRPFCGRFCNIPDAVASVALWLGYVNSLLNPVIYTVFNPDFRLAFGKILFGKYRKKNIYRSQLSTTTVSNKP